MLQERLEIQHQTEIERALEAFDPKNFGFIELSNGWRKEINDLGPVCFAPLRWEHVHKQVEGKNGEMVPTLEFIRQLQETVWGMEARDTVPSNVLSIISDTGGSIIVAYSPEKGFNRKGWLGFVFGFGGRNGILVSHMMGVNETTRGGSIGWHLKVLQAYEALKTQHYTMKWTYDALRGANARLNIEKLGAIIRQFTIDKYGPLKTELYGNVPTDRFTAEWHLTNPQVHQRVNAVFRGEYNPLTLEKVVNLPVIKLEAPPKLLREVLNSLPPQLAVEIPGDIDMLMKHNPQMAINWRQELREIFSNLLTTHKTVLGREGIIDTKIETAQGPYIVTGFATGKTEKERRSFYILEETARINM